MSMDIHWYLWIPEVIHKYMKIFMNFYWSPCISIDVCGDPWIFHDIPLSFCSILLGTRCTTFRIWCRLVMVWLGWFRCRSGLGSVWDKFSVLLDQDSIALVLFWCRFGSVWGVTSHPVLEMWILFAMIAYFLSEHPGITHRFGSNWGLQAHVDRISMNHCFWELQQMKQIPISYVMWRCSKKHGALDSNGHHMISVGCPEINRSKILQIDLTQFSCDFCDNRMRCWAKTTVYWVLRFGWAECEPILHYLKNLFANPFNHSSQPLNSTFYIAILMETMQNKK